MWRSNMKGVNRIVEQEGEGEEKKWELARAFAMDTNWPPRSYTCTFCRREFRSAQALGGHMNVHRRDRARLHHQSTLQAQAQAQAPSTVTSPTSHHHHYHQLANNNSFRGNNNNNNNNNFEVMASTSRCTNNYNYNGVQVYNEMLQGVIKVDNHEERVPINEDELDLELRLGHLPISSSPAALHEKLFENNSSNNNVSVLNFR